MFITQAILNKAQIIQFCIFNVCTSELNDVQIFLSSLSIMGQINHCLIACYRLEIALAVTGGKRPQFKLTCVQTVNIVYHFYIYANDYKIVNSQKTLRKKATSCLQKEISDRNFSPFPSDYAVSQRGNHVRQATIPRATQSFAINYRIISWGTQACCMLKKNNTLVWLNILFLCAYFKISWLTQFAVQIFLCLSSLSSLK